jgi:hypothetical protein
MTRVSEVADAEADSFIAEHPKGFYGSATVIGSGLAIAWFVLAGIMLVSFGAWGWVVWPAVVVLSLRRIAFGRKLYKSKVAPYV